MYSDSIKNRAVKLRRQGKSLLHIAQELHVAKSTASLWLRSVENAGLYATMTKKEWMVHIQKMSHESAQKRKLAREEFLLNQATARIKHFQPDNHGKMAMLSLLYWAEGSKGKRDIVNFANTDPELCLLFITLLRRCCQLDESKFRLVLHLQEQHDEATQKRYWSQLLDIPLSQFTKTTWKKKPNSGKRYRQNYHGICFIRYNSVAIRREVMAYAHAIARKLTIAHPSFNG